MGNLAQELAQEYGGNVSVEEVNPGTGTDPFSANAQTAASPPASPGAGQEPAPSTAGGASDTGAQAPQPQAPAPPDEEPDATAPPAPSPAPAPAAPLDDTEYAQAQTDLEAELDNLLRERQSGYDRRMNQMEQEFQNQLEQKEEELDRHRQEIRQLQAEGLPPEQRLRLEQEWDFEDQKRELDQQRTELFAFHDDLEIANLTMLYNQYEVDEEELRVLPSEERLAFCEKTKADFLEAEYERLLRGGVPRNGAQPPASAQPPPPPPPAGASAPTDVGGGAPPQQPRGPNTDQSRDAMTENVGSGWESASSLQQRGQWPSR